MFLYVEEECEQELAAGIRRGEAAVFIMFLKYSPGLMHDVFAPFVQWEQKLHVSSSLGFLRQSYRQ